MKCSNKKMTFILKEIEEQLKEKKNENNKEEINETRYNVSLFKNIK